MEIVFIFLVSMPSENMLSADPNPVCFDASPETAFRANSIFGFILGRFGAGFAARSGSLDTSLGISSVKLIRVNMNIFDTLTFSSGNHRASA